MNERILELLPTLALSLGVGVVALIVATIVHEFGHALAGIASGLHVARVQLGPIVNSRAARAPWRGHC